MTSIQAERHEAWKTLMKQSLHQAVVKVLLEADTQALTMDRIAQAAGIAKGTLYNYFEDKEELLHYVVKSSLDPLEEEADRILSSEGAADEKLLDYARRMLGYFEENRELLRILQDPELSRRGMKEGRDRHTRLVLKAGKVFEEGIKAGIFEEAPANKLGAMFVMSCMALMMGRVWMEKRSPVEDDARLLMRVFMRGSGKGGNQR